LKKKCTGKRTTSGRRRNAAIEHARNNIKADETNRKLPEILQRRQVRGEEKTQKVSTSTREREHKMNK